MDEFFLEVETMNLIENLFMQLSHRTDSPANATFIRHRQAERSAIMRDRPHI